jgi:hypothetical protein
MPGEPDPVRGEIVAAHGVELSGTLPGTQPQGKDNLLLFPARVGEASSRGGIRCRERLGGLLKYYSRAA